MDMVNELIKSAKTKIIKKLSGFDDDRYSVLLDIRVGDNPIANDETLEDMEKFMKDGKKKKFIGNFKLNKCWKSYTNLGTRVCPTLRGQAFQYRDLCSARDSEMEKVDKSAYERILKSREKFKRAAEDLMTGNKGRDEAIKKIKQKHEEAENKLKELKAQFENAKQEQEKLDNDKKSYDTLFPKEGGLVSLNEVNSAVAVVKDIDIKGHENIKRKIGELANKLGEQIKSLSENFKTTINVPDSGEVFEIYFSDRKNPKQNFQKTCGDLSANQLKEVNLAIDVANSKLKALKGAVKTASSEYKKKVKATEKEQKKAAKQEKAKARAEKKAAKK